MAQLNIPFELSQGHNNEPVTRANAVWRETGSQTLEAAIADILAQLAGLSGSVAPSTLPVILRQLASAVTPTHAPNEKVYKPGFFSVMQANITDRTTRAMTLVGDTDDLTITTGTLTGFPRGRIGWDYATVGFHIAELPAANKSILELKIAPTANTAYGWLSTNSSGQWVMVNPANHAANHAFNDARGNYALQVGDWLIIEAVDDGSYSMQYDCWVYRTDTLHALNDIFFVGTAESNVQDFMSFHDIHFQHAGGTNERTVFDAFFYAQHDGYFGHNAAASEFDNFQVTGAEDADGIAGGLLKWGIGADLFEFSEGLKLPNTSLIRNPADDADLNVANELIKLDNLLAADDVIEYNPFSATASGALTNGRSAIVKPSTSTTAADIVVTITSGNYGRKYTVINDASVGDLHITTTARAATGTAALVFHPGDTGIIVVDSVGNVSRVTVPMLKYNRDFTFSPPSGTEASIPAAEINDYNHIRFRNAMRLINLPQIPPGFNRTFKVTNVTGADVIIRSSPGGNETLWPAHTSGEFFTNGPGNQAIISSHVPSDAIAIPQARAKTG